MKNDIENAISTLKRGIVDLYTEEDLRKKLALDRPLKIKLGVDPTSQDLHMGHALALNKMRAFQDLGHTGILLIGDFTARIGDPSGRDATRPVLTFEQVRANAENYTKQAFKILDQGKTDIRFNSEWLMPFVEKRGNEVPELLSALSKITLSRVVEREDFKNRMKEGS